MTRVDTPLEKVYQCDEELKQIFLANGWIETTDEHDKRFGKKRFKPNKSSRYIMCFDHDYLRLIENSSIQTIGCNISADTLKKAIWYIKLPKNNWTRSMMPKSYNTNDMNTFYNLLKDRSKYSSIGYADKRRLHRQGIAAKKLLKNFDDFKFS